MAVAVETGIGVVACCFAFATGFIVSFQVIRLREKRRIRELAQSQTADVVDETFLSCEGISRSVLLYLMRLTRLFDLGLTQRLCPLIPGAGLDWFDQKQQAAGLEGAVSREAFGEGRVRLALLGAGLGCLVGALLSNTLMVMGLFCGAVAGFFLPKRAVVRQCQERSHQLERELPEFLEVTALGLRSGLPFDRSFSLYGEHFDTALGQACRAAQNQWGLGLKTREQALRDWAKSYDSVALRQVTDTMVRSLRFGSTLSAELEQAAAETRALRRAHRQEQVAKAPVKMMIPTGTLILPAMLLLVLGPILLEMAGGFS